MPERRDAPDAYQEYVARRRGDAAAAEAAAKAAAPAKRAPYGYLDLVLILSAVEFALISVAAAVYATATDGVGFGVVALLGAGVMAAYLTAGAAFIPAFLVAWPLLHLLRRLAARSGRTPG